jgi:flagellar biosynthesis protein FliQ
MAERSLPLVPSMVLSLVVVIIWHEAIFNILVNFWDSFFEQMINNSL